MLRLRPLLWLIALVAFVAPPLAAWAAPASPRAGHVQELAIEQGGQGAAMMDCDAHKPPPPEDCPSKDTAKHASGDCCPSMGGGIALLPADAMAAVDSLPTLRNVLPAHDLTGLAPVKDPPPPRA